MDHVGFSELVLIFVIGLLVLGPERLPKVASQIGRWVGRARRTATQLRHQLEREIALNDLAESQKRKQESAKEKPAPKGGEANESTGEPTPAEETRAEETPAEETPADSADADSGAAAGAQRNAEDEPPPAP